MPVSSPTMGGAAVYQRGGAHQEGFLQVNLSTRIGAMTQTPETLGQQLARISATLLSDPLSEATRRRQTSLLLSAGTGLLTSWAVIAPGAEASIFVFRFTVSNATAITLLFGVLSLYFAVAYAIAAYQDLAIYGYRTKPALEEIEAAYDRVLKARDALAEKAVQLQRGLARRDDLSAKADAIRAAYQQKKESLNAERHRAAAQVSALMATLETRPDSPARRKATDDFEAVENELRALEQAESRELQALGDGAAASGHVTSRGEELLLLVPDEKGARERFVELARPLQAHVRLKTYRAWLEIVVPLGLATLALYSSVAFAVSSVRH